MSLRQDLLLLIETLAKARHVSVSRISTIVFNHGTMHSRLAAGADITVGRAEEAIRWFSDNWPEGVEWPESVTRPDPKAASPEAA